LDFHTLDSATLANSKDGFEKGTSPDHDACGVVASIAIIRASVMDLLQRRLRLEPMDLYMLSGELSERVVETLVGSKFDTL